MDIGVVGDTQARIGLGNSLGPCGSALQQVAVEILGDAGEVRAGDGRGAREGAIRNHLKAGFSLGEGAIEIGRYDQSQAGLAGIQRMDQIVLAPRRGDEFEVGRLQPRNQLAAGRALRIIEHDHRIIPDFRRDAVAGHVDGAAERPEQDEQDRHIPQQLAAFLAQHGQEPAHQPIRFFRNSQARPYSSML